MIIQRLFSKTWTHITDPEKRAEKVKELKEKKKEVEKRLDEINAERKEGLEKSAKGTNWEKYTDDKGKQKSRFINAEEVEKRAKDKKKDLKGWMNSFQDTTKRTPKPSPAPKDVRSGFEKTVEVVKEKGKEVMKNPKTKKWGYIGAGSLVGTAAVSGVDAAVKKHKEKKKENEIREKIAGGKK